MGARVFGGKCFGVLSNGGVSCFWDLSMADGGAEVGGVKVDFWRNDDVMWWGKHESFAHGVEKWGGSCSVLAEWAREGRVSGGGSRG